MRAQRRLPLRIHQRPYRLRRIQRYHGSQDLNPRPVPAVGELYSELRQRAEQGQVGAVKKLVEDLLRQKREKPNVQMYSALILSNVSPKEGSAAKVSSLLDEMRECGLEMDTMVCHDSLKALAIHPDPFLVSSILDTMQKHWDSLSDSGWHDLVAGLVKDTQIEAALEALQAMFAARVPVEGWLYEMVIYSLCDLGELDEALRVMIHRVSAGHDIGRSSWYHLFDVGCSKLHYPTILFVWGRQIEPNRLNPSAGQCLAVLTVASRLGNVYLALDTIRFLVNRHARLEKIHYELLMDAYLVRDEIIPCLTISCNMATAKITIDKHVKKKLVDWTIRVPPGGKEISGEGIAERAARIFRTLHGMRSANPELQVPIAALDVVIESVLLSATLPRSHPNGTEVRDATTALDNAVSYYKSLYKICTAGPDTNTFNALFEGCLVAAKESVAGARGTVWFLQAEMKALDVPKDVVTYDCLIRLCVEGTAADSEEVGDEPFQTLADAFHFLDEMRSCGWLPRRSTMESLVIKSQRLGEEQRAAEVIKMMSEAGIETSEAEESSH